MDFDEEILEIYIQSKEWIISGQHLLWRNQNRENVCSTTVVGASILRKKSCRSTTVVGASLNRSHLSPGFCKELNIAKMSMISNHSDEYRSVNDLNSGDNSIVDLNVDVLNDDSDGKEGILTKGPWGTEEDKRLKSYVTKKGPGKWRIVARQLNRTPKSCRNRWCNQLNPKISHAPFTNEEDKLIANMVDYKGWGKWSRIAKKLKGRTDNQVKNRWYSKLAKQYGELRVKSPSGKLTQTAMRRAKAARGNVKGKHSSISNSISASLRTAASTFHPAPASAPAFNRFSSLSLCPPGHETDDVLYPGLLFNPSGMYPLPSQQ